MKNAEQILAERIASESDSERIMSLPELRTKCYEDEDGKSILYNTIEIKLDDYINLIKEKAYEEGYSWGVHQTLNKIFGDEED